MQEAATHTCKKCNRCFLQGIWRPEQRCARRAVVVIGDEKGRVGVGTATAKEVVDAVQKAVADGKKHLITVSTIRRSGHRHSLGEGPGRLKSLGLLHC